MEMGKEMGIGKGWDVMGREGTTTVQYKPLFRKETTQFSIR